MLSPPIPVEGRKVWTLAFSPDGNRVAIGTQTGFISLLDLLDPSPALTAMQLQFPGPSSELHDVWSCSWSEKGDLAAACQDGKVYIWQDLLRALESRTPPAVVILQNLGKTATIPVHAVAWDHSSGVLAMGDGAGNLRTWDGRTLSEPVRAAANAIWSLAWSLDGRLACGSWDRSISIWKNDNSVPGATLSRLVSNPLAHDQWVRDVTWIDNGAIASVGDDGMLKLWNSSDLALLGSEQSPTTELWRLAYSPSADTIATANDDGAVRIYLRALPRPDTHGDHLNTVACLGFVNSTILSFDSDGVVDIFDPSSRKEEKVQLPVDLQSNIRTVRFHPKIGAFVVGYNLAFLHQSVKGRIAVWYPQPPIRVKRMDFAEPIASVSCHPTEPIVAFVTPAGTLGLRTVPDLQPLPSQSDFPINLKSDSLLVARIGWSNRGDVLLLALNRENKNTSQIVRFHFDGKSLSPVNRENPVEVPALIGSFDWHPSDQLVAIGTRGGATILHDFTAGQTGPVVGHDGPVNVVAWSADGLQLFTGGDDRIIKVWAYHSAAKDKLTSVTTLHHDKGGVHAMAVCPDGKGIYTAGTDPGVFYWPATSYSVGAIVARAHQMVNRNMTRGEWLRYAQSEESRQQKYEKTFEDLPDLSGTESQ